MLPGKEKKYIHLYSKKIKRFNWLKLEINTPKKCIISSLKILEQKWLQYICILQQWNINILTLI